MIGERLRIKGTLEVLTPFHTGTGNFDDETGLVNDEGKAVGVADICVDAAGRPYIPGTTLKGVLKAFAEQSGTGACAKEKEIRDRLFGAIKKTGAGQAGLLTVYGATLAKPGEAGELPKSGDGRYIAARTSIDPATGAVESGKLFYQHMVAPGASFDFHLLLQDDGADDEARAMLLGLLAAAAAPEGIAVGKGQSDGQGRLRVDLETFCAETERVSEEGELRREKYAPWTKQRLRQSPPASRKVAARATLRLTCETPFYVKDWAYEPPGRRDDDKGPQGPNVKALRRGPAIPELPGTSLMGALRARAQWLFEIDCLRRGIDANTVHDPVAGLFGSTGKRARLGLELLKLVGTAKRSTLTSVQLDRFSGAPIDNALVTAEVFHDVTFEASLTLGLPWKDTAPEDGEAEQRLYETLMQDIGENGIDLGHGTTKGFGWFGVEHV